MQSAQPGTDLAQGFVNARTGKPWPTRGNAERLIEALERCADLIEEVLEAHDLEGASTEEDLSDESDGEDSEDT